MALRINKGTFSYSKCSQEITESPWLAKSTLHVDEMGQERGPYSDLRRAFEGDIVTSVYTALMVNCKLTLDNQSWSHRM